MAEKVLIIGSGPAGLTAAIYAARADLDPLLIEGMQRGGQLMLTTEVENYPGFPERFGTRIISSDVTEVDLSERPFKVSVGADVYEAESLIISTGASARWLGIPGEEKLRGYGVSACATCDGFFFRDREIAIVGGGDSAMEEALFLTKFASKVTIVHRRDEFRASKIMAQRAIDHPKIGVLWNTTVDEVLGDDLVTGLKITNTQTGEQSILPVEGFFLAIGHDPNTNIFQDQLELDIAGYVVTEAGSTTTSVAGVFAAGDVVDHYYQQAVTAAGMGCQAAIDVEHWLDRIES
jgi:thioredoxin reductase (NADPH)